MVVRQSIPWTFAHISRLFIEPHLHPVKLVKLCYLLLSGVVNSSIFEGVHCRKTVTDRLVYFIFFMFALFVMCFLCVVWSIDGGIYVGIKLFFSERVVGFDS